MNAPGNASHLVAVSVVGRDRPGIVADVTGLLYEQGCNLLDVTSTILAGHFAMLLVVRAPTQSSAETIETAFREASSTSDLVVVVRAVLATSDETTLPTHMVSVYGADRPGIVMTVSRALASAGASITDLTSRVIGSDEEPVYALMLEVAAPDATAVEAELDQARSELDIDVSIHPLEVDIL